MPKEDIKPQFPWQGYSPLTVLMQDGARWDVVHDSRKDAMATQMPPSNPENRVPPNGRIASHDMVAFPNVQLHRRFCRLTRHTGIRAPPAGKGCLKRFRS
jgi:hypothetical protein